MSATAAVQAGLIVVWVVAGAALAIRRRSDRLGPVVLAGAGLAALGDLAGAAAPGAWAETIRAVTATVLPVLALHLLVSLPDGRLPTRGARSAVVTGYTLAALAGLALGVTGHGAGWLATGEVLVAGAVGLLWSNSRYRVASALDRRRMQWFGWAIAVVAELVLVIGALHVLSGWPGRVAVPALASTSLLPLSLLAGTSNRLVARVDRLLTRTVAVAGLSAVVVGVYVVVVVGLGRVPEQGERSLLLLSMVAAAIVALLYLPARDRLTALANRLVYGEQVAPDETLRTFGSRLTRAIPLDELLLQLAESLRKTMGLAACEVWTGSGGRLDRNVSVPHREPAWLTLGAKEAPVVARAGVSGGTWLEVWLPAVTEGRDPALVRVAPVAHAGGLLGLIVVERRAGSEALSDENDRVLVELARQVGLALHNVHLDSALQDSLEQLRRTNDELKASRARIVAAGDAERRRLERNLHDGAQQHLVALAVKVRLARDALHDDPSEAASILDELRSDVTDAVAELRALAHGIFPPLLMSGGLAEALPAAATRAALPVTVTTEGLRRHPSDIEAAIYFCCLEALQNAGKHAGQGASATIRVWEDSVAGRLCFEVADTGAGFEPERGGPAGHGFVNMADRLGAIDGAVEVRSAPGNGTRITGSVPVTVSP